MAKLKIKDLREKGKEELEKMLAESRQNARKFRFDIAAKQAKNNRQVRHEKRQVARLLTLIKEKNGK